MVSLLSKRKIPGETHLQNSHKSLWVPPVTCWMLLEQKRGPLPSPSVAPSPNQQLESCSSTATEKEIVLPRFHTLHSSPCQYFITFYYLNKSTSSSFPCINRILNLIIITTMTSHQGLCFVIIHTAEHSRHYRSTNCRDSSELLPRTSLPPINATQLRDHAITSSVTSEPNLLTLILISVH